MQKKLSKEIKETCINYVDCDDMVSVSTYQKKYINKLKALVEDHPDEVKVVAENDDGTVCVHLPLKYVHISFGEHKRREMSEDQKVAAAERLKKFRATQNEWLGE